MTAAPVSPTSSTPSRHREIDIALMQRCRLGNPLAIQAFVQHHQQLVFAFLYRLLGHESVVEDLAQEVFVRALRALPHFDILGPARVSTWLLTIASRLALDERRRAPRKSTSLELEPLSVADNNGPEVQHQRRELGRALTCAVYTLAYEQREAFILVEIHGLTMEELADITRVPLGTAKARLSRARERLRELLGSLWEQLQ